SGVSATLVEYFNEDGKLVWSKDERGVLTYQTFDPITGGIAQRIKDANTSQVTNEPSGWVTPSGAGFGNHHVTDFTYDARGRLVQTLGPPHEAIVSGAAVTVRTADWQAYIENGPLADDETRSGRGYATGSG